MILQDLVHDWFQKWEVGDFYNLPITGDFKHTSPYGVISGKDTYIDLVAANKDKFLGHKFEIHDQIFENKRACVRYTAIQDNFTQDVSEWYYPENGLIKEIVAYYNIEGTISEDRKLHMSGTQ